MWTACAAWANFQPVVWEAKAHEETLLFPDECTHFFEGNEDTLHDSSDERFVRRTILEIRTGSTIFTKIPDGLSG
jgi:hypothetical protein